MSGRDLFWLVVIIGLTAVAAWLSTNDNYPISQGLDLQGGLQVLLEADVAEGTEVTDEEMNTAASIISQRINALGVAEPLIQVVTGAQRVLVELPGLKRTEDAIALIQETALLEFVNTGQQPLFEGDCIRTNLNNGEPSPCEVENGETVEFAQANPAPTFETVLTGGALRDASVQADQFQQVFVTFDMNPEEGQIFEQYTRDNIGNFLTIVLDKRVISSPRINGVIPGSGVIEGDFTVDEAQNLSLQLKYGSLPIPMKVSSTRQVGATLGAESIAASLQAGIIGLSIVLLFMLALYRLPGLMACIALILYALFNFAIFKYLGVTMTLPAITGFLISTGMAVDANILVFERLKEELRTGVRMSDALPTAFERAWTSIRDANVATLIICFILWSFGRSFGASVVQGFAITLAIGVVLSMFTAIIVTRTFVMLSLGNMTDWLRERQWLVGL